MLISIIIPTYNRVNAVKKCIKSIASQQCAAVEAIVIDDASSDATRSYLEVISNRYEWLKIIINSYNRGVNYTRNRGIEKASGKYILFLDSDDQLADGILEKVLTVLHQHPTINHFLFQVSDRWEEFKNAGGIREIYYEDWIKSSIGGDFTHVISTDIMKRFLFFEQFRMHEYVNWLRIKKVSAPQLLVPVVVAERERGRPDSLTRSAKLSDRATIESKFDAQKLYYTLYHDDLKKFKSEALKKKLLSAISLGVACNRKKDGYNLMKLAGGPTVKILGIFILLLPPVILRRVIFYWSALK